MENLAGFDRAKAEADIGKRHLDLAHLNRALGINDSNVSSRAAIFLREERAGESARQAAALAVANPPADNSVFAGVPIGARLRVMENDMAEADFASPELNPEDRHERRLFDVVENGEVVGKTKAYTLKQANAYLRSGNSRYSRDAVAYEEGDWQRQRRNAIIAANESRKRSILEAYRSRYPLGYRKGGVLLPAAVALGITDPGAKSSPRKLLSKVGGGEGAYRRNSLKVATLHSEDLFAQHPDYSVGEWEYFKDGDRQIAVLPFHNFMTLMDSIIGSNEAFGNTWRVVGFGEAEGTQYAFVETDAAGERVEASTQDKERFLSANGFAPVPSAQEHGKNLWKKRLALLEPEDFTLGRDANGNLFAFNAPVSALSITMPDAYTVYFASGELNPDAATRIGVTQRDLDEHARNLGQRPWRHRKTTWEEVYQRSEALLNSGKFIEELAADVAQHNRPVTAEQIIALKQHLLEVGKQFNEVRTLRRDIEREMEEPNGADMDYLRELKGRLDEVRKEEGKLSALYHNAHVASKAAASKTGLALAANRAQFDEEFNFLGMKEARRDALGRELTPQELKELGDICDRAKDLTEDAREQLWAAVHAQAEKTIRDLFNKSELERATTTRKTDEYAKYRKKYLDAMAHLKVYANSVGGSLVGISGDEYGTWNKPLFNLLLWHRFENPDITAADALQAVVEDVNTYVEADANTVARILTGFERSWDINRHDDVLRGGRDLRSQILTDLQIDKLLNKEMPGRTGPIQADPSEELREKRHARDALKADLEEETNDPRKLQSRQRRWLKWYDNRIEEMLREIEAGERLPAPKRGLQWTEEMKRKRAEYEELKAERDRVCGVNELSEEEKIARYEKSLEKTLRRAVERLQRARRDDFRKARRETVTSDYIQSLQNAIRETNEAIRQEKKDRLNYGRTQEELEKFNAAREKRRLERIQYWQTLTLPDADRSTKKRAEIYMPPEQKARYDAAGEQLKKLRRQVLDMRAQDELAKRPWAVRYGIEYFRFINNMTRMFLATADHSAVMRQMAQLSMSHPLIAARVFKETLGAIVSADEARRIDDEYRNDPRIKEAIDKGWLNWRDMEATGGVNDVEMFSGMQQGIDIPFTRDENGRPKRLHIDDIKGVGAILRGSERVYATYVNALSAEIYLSLTSADKFTARLLFGQQGLTDFAKREIAARINMANGSAHIESASRKQFMKDMTAVFWAPKLALSRLQLVAGYDIWHPLLTNEVDTKTRLRVAGLNAIEHARARLAMIALGTLMLMLAGDDDDKDKWKRAGWFDKYLQSIAPRIGNTTLDYSGGEISWYRLLAKWATLMKETGTGKTVYLADKDGNRQSFGADIMGETWRFLQGKFNPLTSNGIAKWTGKDYVGKPFGWSDFALNTFVPLGANDTVKSFASNGLGRGLLLAPFITLGAGGNTYEPKRYETAVNKFKEVAKQYDEIRADRTVPDDERHATLAELERDNPILKSRSRIEGKLQTVRYFESQIRKLEKLGVERIPKSLTEGLEKSRNDLLELIRKSR